MLNKQSKPTIRRMVDTLTYIYSHYENRIDLQSAAEKTMLSPSHFRRLFQQYTGESFHTHINRIKLEQAAIWLKYTNKSTIEIALDAEYNSREGFSRAFKVHFHQTPKLYRETIREKSQTLITQNGYDSLSPPIKIVYEPSIKVAFFRQYGDYFKVPFAWAKMGKWAKQREILQKSTFCMGLNYDDPEITPSKHLRYDVCIPIYDDMEISKDDHEEITIQEIPAGWFIQLDFEGTIFEEDKIWDYFVHYYLPQSGYTLRDFCCQSIYSLNLIPTNKIEASMLLLKKYQAKLRIPIFKPNKNI